MKWLSSEHFANLRWPALFGLVALAASLAVLKVPALSLCLALVVSAAVMQYQRSRAKSREASNSKLIPELAEILAGGLEAGLSLIECAEQLAGHSNPRLAEIARQMSAILDSNLAMSTKLNRCAELVSCREGNLLFELLETSMVFGDRGLRETLLGFSRRCRDLQALEDELDSRLGWIRGTATLAQFTPWVVVVLLSLRTEGAASFGTDSGAALLIAGFVVTQFAGRLISLASTRAKNHAIFEIGGLTSAVQAS